MADFREFGSFRKAWEFGSRAARPAGQLSTGYPQDIQWEFGEFELPKPMG